MRNWRNLSWRLGRRLYMRARGEDLSGDMTHNGEAALQRAVLDALADAPFVQVVDIGANRGEWTLSLLTQASVSRRKPDRLRVDLFEPVPSTRAVLDAALASRDDTTCMKTHSVAMSEKSGASRMAVMSKTGGTNTLHAEDFAATAAGNWIEVTLTTLDAFCRDEGIDRIHLAKCDAEGHDLLVLRGARPLLEASRIDVLQFEYNHCWVFSRNFLRDVFELVDGLPYVVARVHAQGVEVHDAWHPELERFFQCNFALVHRDALRWFDVRHARFTDANTLA